MEKGSDVMRDAQIWELSCQGDVTGNDETGIKK